MPAPSKPLVFYASAIVVKAVTDPNGPTFELDLELAGTWVSTQALSRSVVDEIRAASTSASNTAGTEFEALLTDERGSIHFLVDRSTPVRDEWSFA